MPWNQWYNIQKKREISFQVFLPKHVHRRVGYVLGKVFFSPRVCVCVVHIFSEKSEKRTVFIASAYLRFAFHIKRTHCALWKRRMYQATLIHNKIEYIRLHTEPYIVFSAHPNRLPTQHRLVFVRVSLSEKKPHFRNFAKKRLIAHQHWCGSQQKAKLRLRPSHSYSRPCAI